MTPLRRCSVSTAIVLAVTLAVAAVVTMGEGLRVLIGRNEPSQEYGRLDVVERNDVTLLLPWR